MRYIPLNICKNNAIFTQGNKTSNSSIYQVLILAQKINNLFFMSKKTIHSLINLKFLIIKPPKFHKIANKTYQ